MEMKFNKYDSVFLNDKEFVIIDILNVNSKFYLLLSYSMDNEELDFDNLKIAEYTVVDGIDKINEVIDKKLYLELSRKFILNIENL